MASVARSWLTTSSVRSEADRARDFAKRYVALVEALQREGVTVEDARTEARLSAAMTVYGVESEEQHYDPALGPCPTCERG
jgi:hypothetical protein